MTVNRKGCITFGGAGMGRDAGIARCSDGRRSERTSADHAGEVCATATVWGASPAPHFSRSPSELRRDPGVEAHVIEAGKPG